MSEVMLLNNGSAISESNPMPVSLMSPLNKDIDSIEVGKVGKGAISSVNDGNDITATLESDEIDCRGYNSLLVQAVIDGGTWSVKLMGSLSGGGTFVDLYDNDAAMSISNITASRIILFKGIPDYVKVTITEDVDGGSALVKVQPLNT